MYDWAAVSIDSPHAVFGHYMIRSIRRLKECGKKYIMY